MLSDGIRSVVSATMQTTHLINSAQMVNKPVASPVVKRTVQAPESGVKSVKTNSAATLELSSEGLHKSDSEKAKNALKEVKQTLKSDNLKEIHSNLRLMRVNHLIYD